MRQGRHVEERPSRRRLGRPTAWIAGFAALCVGGAIALSMSPAEASAQTVHAQLTLSGVASPDSPTGGSVVGVHPGDSVVLTASAIPTAGAPAGLSDALSGLVSGVAGLQVKITSGNLPGAHAGYVLGAVAHCGGHASLPLKSLAKGTYSFTYVVQKMSLLTGLLGAVTGCQKTTVTPTHDQLGTLTKNNVKFTDNAQYRGSIVAAADPPKGTIGVQLPKQSISVKAGPVHTSVTLPGATVGVPNPLPSLTKGLPHLPGVGGKKSTTPAAGGKSTGVNYSPPALTVPERVMPHAVAQGGSGGGFAGPGTDSGNGGAGFTAPAAQVTSTAAAAPRSSTAAKAKPVKTVDLAAKSQPAGQQLPVLLAIVAILALGTVTATYARLYLMRRSAG